MSDTVRPGLVDAHHHVWNLDRRRQPWLDDPGHEPIRRSFDTGNLRSTATRTIVGRRLERTVVVQCLTSLPETRELLALADADPLIGAVVGWVDLTSLAINDILDGLRAGPGGTHLRAVRHIVQAEPDPDWLQRPVVESGLRAVRDQGLGYDVLIRSHQLPQAIRLADSIPDLPIVLDHAGKPPIAGGDLTDWERQIRLLAGHPQVRCKMSGLVTEADHEKWTIDDIRPVWDVLLSAFTPYRLMFGSDWPVCVLAGGWNPWAAAVEELLAGCSASETQAILAGTATDFYRLRPG
ncbi:MULTISPECIES: amidohydrolase family protein [Streptomyces]|uniref:amidohydrolase family protein n=1 Tax=Streptomyces TaxID=1883 RepID=UPI000A3C804F|nr:MULTISPECIES: amidohydrolase family protein [Streptomyces]MDX3586368.1 amidohydrolase family protein [Streptomyces europaeiscabiei]MDX3612413.1 amidohydrolase family protein [Streptomyces europaeiscabiei]MDX3635630.1 amidohydrolase family protein [Streptomyces europaeiscabiei]MDX3653861.1 amidohydrolase family protein [Streptomyces europaeiscabiei]